MEIPQFVMVRPSQAAGPKAVECQVAPLRALSKISGQWSKAAKQNWIFQLKELKKNLKADTTTFKGRLSFDAGGSWQGLFISDSVKTFELHSAMRKSFEP